MGAASRALVVGGSGILAPLVAALADAGHQVVSVARGDPARASPRVESLRADTATAAGAASVRTAGPYALAAVYRPAVTEETLTALLDAVGGRAVVLFTSSVADPARGGEIASLPGRLRPRAGDGVLLLGWRPDPRGWHSPQEVSAAAAEVLRSGEDGVLGVLRPWSGRPR